MKKVYIVQVLYANGQIAISSEAYSNPRKAIEFCKKQGGEPMEGTLFRLYDEFLNIIYMIKEIDVI